MPKKILIIDDEEDMRIYLETVFRKAGYATETAVNGDDALARLTEIDPDLITLDILMPQKSGLKFFQALRDELATVNLPVIVVSGVSGHSDFFDPKALGGPTAFMDKPINPDTLLAGVKALLGE
ncbi:MAG: response regulator [candidate division Zixibacteria bacterium]|nr:response regulator [candidate division Zixibacteria bacterium]